LAVLFLLALFLLKNGLLFKNNPNKNQNATAGLAYNYGNETIGDLVNKSTTGDGIPDWEKRLYGLDPTKRDNVPGVPDSVTIAKLQAEQEMQNSAGTGLTTGNFGTGTTQTDKFSQDLFATVAAATQNGQPLSQDAVNQISNSLNDQIQNSPQRKIYTMASLQITNDNNLAAIQKYNDALNSLYSKMTIKYNVINILQKFVGDGTNVDDSALAELNPIILQTNTVIMGMAKMEVPQFLASAHLNLLNALQKTQENLSDIKLYNTDAVVAFSAINQYQTSVANLTSSVNNLFNAITQKLKQ
jgi:hypothetical protein